MRIEALPTPFDTAYNTIHAQPLCEFNSLPAPTSTALPPLAPSATALSEPVPPTHDTPSAFGLTDPIGMDDYVRPLPVKLSATAHLLHRSAWSTCHGSCKRNVAARSSKAFPSFCSHRYSLVLLQHCIPRRLLGYAARLQ